MKISKKRIAFGVLLALATLAWAGNFTTDNLKVNQVATLTQTNDPLCVIAPFTTDGPINNDWNPACLATNTVLQVQGGDNEGTVITGIDAIDNGASTTIAVASNGASLPQATINVASTTGFTITSGFVVYVTTGAGQQTVECTGATSTTFTGCTGGVGVMSTGGSVLGGMLTGTVRTICNLDATSDGGPIGISIEDSSSKPNNRFWLNTAVSFTHEDRFRIDTGACQEFLYTTPVQIALAQPDPTFFRWVPIDASTKLYREDIQNLGFFPALNEPNVTGTNNDWGPDANCTPPLGPGYPLGCSGGASGKFEDYSEIVITTFDGTGATITGMLGAAAGSPNHGKDQNQIKILINQGPGPITITNQDAGSAPANQFTLPNTSSIVIPVNEARIFYTLNQGWALLGTGSSVVSNVSDVNQLIKATGPNTYGVSNVVDNGTTTTIGAFQSSDTANPGTGSHVTIQPTGANIAHNSDTLDVIENRSFVFPNAAVGINVNVAGAGGVRSGITVNASGGASSTSLLAESGQFAIDPEDFGDNTNPFIVNAVRSSYNRPVAISNVFTIGNSVDYGGAHGAIASACPACVPTVNNGTLQTGADNFVGRITGIGATTTTLTYGGTPGFTSSECFVQPTGSTPFFVTVTPSATAPVFNCFNAAGVATNCPDLSYQCWGH